MFPVFERTMETDKGKSFIPRLSSFRKSLIRTGHFVERLPGPIQRSFISLISEKRYTVDDSGSLKKAMKSLFTYNCAQNIIQMLDDLSKFGDNSKFSNVFHTYGNKLTLYYGQDDAWAPVSYANRLSEMFPMVDVRIDELKTQHCFVLECCKTFSKVISTFLNFKKMIYNNDNNDNNEISNSNGDNKIHKIQVNTENEKQEGFHVTKW